MGIGNTSFTNDYGKGTVGMDGLVLTPTVGISAAGTTQGTATALTGFTSVVETVSASTAGVALQDLTGESAVYMVFNGTATNCKLYPQTGAAIDGSSANASVTLTAHKGIMLYRESATQWRTIVGA